MKCAKCGAEIKDGCLYCSKCGHEAQVISGYSALEDEYLHSILTQENKQFTEKEKMKSKGTSSSLYAKKKAQMKLLLLLSAMGLLLIGIIGGIGYTIYKNNNSYDYQMQMAKEEMVDRNYEKAISYYEKALEIMPNDIDARLFLADIYMDQQKTDDAMILYMDVINLDGKNIDAYNNLIQIYVERQDFTKIKELSANVTDEEVLKLFEDYLVSAPAIYPEGGTFYTYTTVTMVSIDNCKIYYTLDGSIPSETNGFVYNGKGIELESAKTFTIKAVCCNELGVYSDVIEMEYKIKPKAPACAEMSPESGRFDSVTYITLEADENCAIYYTWDGTNPTLESPKYEEPLEVPVGNNILSVIVVDERTKLISNVNRANYIYEPAQEE